MKKLILLVVCLFSIKIVYANSIEVTTLPYYAKIKENIIQVKKVYDKDNDRVMFNMDYEKYDTNNSFNIYEEVNKDNYGLHYRYIQYFNTMVYYGYNSNPSDLNYFLTQVIIWDLMGSNHSIEIVDKDGNVINDYDEVYKKIYNRISAHISAPPFLNQEHTSEIWSNKTLKYSSYNTILDNPIVDGLQISTEGYNLNIYTEKVGNYKVILTKEYEQINYSYNDGENIYWVSLGGPENLSRSFIYNVYGTKVNIIENIIGVNNKIGDAKSNTKYELYLDDELKLNITDLDNVYVKSNNNYKLKSIEGDIGIFKVEDIEFQVLDSEYTITIDKEVITRNVSIDVKDDYTYYVYLKSTDELYETIDKNTDLITLPYGIYYIKNDVGYFKELEVLDNRDEYIELKSNVIEDKIDNSNNVENLDKDKNNNIENTVNKEEIENKNSYLEDEDIKDNIENPKTLDNLFYYILLFIFTINILFGIIYYKKVFTKHCR